MVSEEKNCVDLLSGRYITAVVPKSQNGTSFERSAVTQSSTDAVGFIVKKVQRDILNSSCCFTSSKSTGIVSKLKWESSELAFVTWL